MAITIELSPNAETALRRAAARRGMVAADLARALLEEQLGREPSANTTAPTTGGELVAYWQAHDVIGAWAARTDIADSTDFARELRRRAETRTRA